MEIYTRIPTPPTQRRHPFGYTYDVEEAPIVAAAIGESQKKMQKLIDGIDGITNLEEEPGDIDYLVKSGLLTPVSKTSWEDRHEIVLHRSYVNSKSTQDSMWLREKLKCLIKINESFLGQISAGAINHGEYFAIVTTMGNEVVVKKCVVIAGTRCQKCAQPVPVDEIESHQRTWDCGIAEGQWLAERKGMRKVTNPDEALAIRAAMKIDTLLIPSRFDVMAPEWVHQAISTYHTNGGFADMSLTEFLEKLAEEKRNV